MPQEQELFNSVLPPIRPDAAVEKLKAEMDSKKNNPDIRVVGEFLLNYLNTNPEAAKKILATDKTIAKSFDEMANVAHKRSSNHISDAEGFAIVLKYFGIEQGRDVKPTVTPPPSVMSTPRDSFDVNLDDLLGG